MRQTHIENGSEVGTLRMGLIGRGIQLSRSPMMHESEAAALGLTCKYELFDTDTGSQRSLPEILDGAEAAGFAGLNVTFPYKQVVIEHLHDLSDEARRIGAVNTVVFRNGRRFGHNTDFLGFSESMRRGMPDVALGTVLLIGAGGAGAAVAHALSDLGVHCLLINDTRDGAAKALADDVGTCAEAVSDLMSAATRADGLVNATPVGMVKMPGSPIDTALLSPRHWVADIIYFPLQTTFLKAARDRGCRTLSGENMAVFQAARAFELFTGRPADPARMHKTFRRFGAD